MHGCYDELVALLTRLGYDRTSGGGYKHRQGRKAVFVGDLVDRGPKIPETVILVKNMVDASDALCVPGNHDIKFMRAVWGRDVQITHGLGDSLKQFEEADKQWHGLSRIAAEFINKHDQPLRAR